MNSSGVFGEVEPPLLRADPQRTALVLSGGGARGAFQVGVWKILMRDPCGLGQAPGVISGTSAGALNGMLIAAGLTPEQMLDFWLDLADHPPVVANAKFFESLNNAVAKLAFKEPLRAIHRRTREARILTRLFSKHRWYDYSGLLALFLEFLLTARFDNVSALLDGIATPYLFDTRPLIDRLRKAIGSDVLRQTKVRLAINTVDVKTGRVVRIVNYKPEKRSDASAKHYRFEPVITLDMILASASIPLLFNPVNVGGHDLWDGGLLVNSPMAPAVALGANRVVPVLVTVCEADVPPRLDTFGHAVERLVDAFLENAYNIDRKLLLDRNALAERSGDKELKIVELFRAIRPQSGQLFNAGSYLYFERKALLAMYEAGQRAAVEWLAKGPERDGREKEE